MTTQRPLDAGKTMTDREMLELAAEVGRAMKGCV